MEEDAVGALVQEPSIVPVWLRRLGYGLLAAFVVVFAWLVYSSLPRFPADHGLSELESSSSADAEDWPCVIHTIEEWGLAGAEHGFVVRALPSNVRFTIETREQTFEAVVADGHIVYKQGFPPEMNGGGERLVCLA